MHWSYHLKLGQNNWQALRCWQFFQRWKPLRGKHFRSLRRPSNSSLIYRRKFFLIREYNKVRLNRPYHCSRDRNNKRTNLTDQLDCDKGPCLGVITGTAEQFRETTERNTGEQTKRKQTIYRHAFKSGPFTQQRILKNRVRLSYAVTRGVWNNRCV